MIRFLEISANALMRLCIALALLLAFTVSAFAQDTTVTLGWGDLAGALLITFLPIAGVALLGLILSLPAIKQHLSKERTEQLEQLAERALGYAALQIADKLKGQTLTIEIQNELARKAAQYAIDHGSKAILDFAGGNAVLQDKMKARLLTSPAVNAAMQGGAPAMAQPVK